MEFKTVSGRVEVNPIRDGNMFHHENIILDIGQELWMTIDSRRFKVHATKVRDDWWVHVLGHTLRLEMIEPGASGMDDEGGLTAPMPGKILEVLVEEGQRVSSGDPLMIMEAMKMEHRIVASHDGIVDKIHYSAGEQVNQGAELLSLSDE